MPEVKPMKKLLLVLTLLLSASAASAQVYTDTPSTTVGPPVAPAGRYRLRNAYPGYPYPSYPATQGNSPDTVEVGRPYYYDPYYYGGYPYGGVSSDGSSVYVPGR